MCPASTKNNVEVQSAKSSSQSSSGKSSRGSAALEARDYYKPKLTGPGNAEPTFFIGGGNGVAMLEEIMTDLGWRRTKDKLDESYNMKWCELKQTINYNTFKEGTQLVNHIPNCNLLTNKLGLVNSLQEYDRVCATTKKRGPKLDFMPETFRLDDPKEREIFKDTFKEGEVWICKPTGCNQGKGIFMVNSREQVAQIFQEQDEKNLQLQKEGKPQKHLNRIIQRYIHNPLLLNNKKFDIRAYMLVASSVPYLVLYHKGYIRLSLHEYHDNLDDLAVHLTNQFIQKKDPKYKEMKEDTIWSMDRFTDYISKFVVPEKKYIGADWAEVALAARMKQIMLYCFNAVKHRLHCKTGYFDLYGFDFMIDDNMKVWLIEVNVNPTLATNCSSLKSLMPPMVKETLYLAIECFEKSRKSKALLPLQSLTNFEVIFNGCPRSNRNQCNASPTRPVASQQQTPPRSRSLSPARRPRITSPTKDPSQGSESPSRRGALPMRPGLKPSPTSTVFLNNGSSSNPLQSTTIMPGQPRNPYMAEKAALKPIPKPTSDKATRARVSAPEKSTTAPASTTVLPAPNKTSNKTATTDGDKSSKPLQAQTDGKSKTKIAKSPKPDQVKTPPVERSPKTTPDNSNPSKSSTKATSTKTSPAVEKGKSSESKSSPGLPKKSEGKKPIATTSSKNGPVNKPYSPVVSPRTTKKPAAEKTSPKTSREKNSSNNNNAKEVKTKQSGVVPLKMTHVLSGPKAKATVNEKSLRGS